MAQKIELYNYLYNPENIVCIFNRVYGGRPVLMMLHYDDRYTTQERFSGVHDADIGCLAKKIGLAYYGQVPDPESENGMIDIAVNLAHCNHHEMRGYISHFFTRASRLTEGYSTECLQAVNDNDANRPSPPSGQMEATIIRLD